MNAKLTITHGLPGCGKSTWAEREIARIIANGGKAFRVNRDDLREELFGAEYHKNKPDNKKEQQVTALQYKRIRAGLSEGAHVFSDDTHLNPRFIPNMVKLAQEYGAEIEQKHFSIDVETCKLRNRIRGEAGGRFVPEHVIDAMAENAYGKDGRIKEFMLGASVVFAYDRAGVEGEDKIEEYNKAQQIKLGVPHGDVVLMDMDGTLADVREVSDKYMSNPKKRNFHMFHTMSEFSPPNEDVVTIAHEAHANGFPIVITTARSSDYSQPTINWLKNNGIPASALFMRHKGDFRKDYESKKSMLDEIKSEGMNPVHAVDDNPQAVQNWEDNGIPVTKLPFHKGIPLASAEGADDSNAVDSTNGDESSSSRTAHIGVDDKGNRVYPKIEVESPFRTGKL